MQRHLRQSGLRREDVSPGFAVLYGAAAGYALWATIYPFDGPLPPSTGSGPSGRPALTVNPPPLHAAPCQ
jgi:hypothetical protein